jgi:hypothetical protein
MIPVDTHAMSPIRRVLRVQLRYRITAWERTRHTPVKNAAGKRYRPALSAIPNSATERSVSGLVRMKRTILQGKREKVMAVAYIECVIKGELSSIIPSTKLLTCVPKAL